MMIETARVIVRPFREEETDALYRIKTDPQVMEFCPDFLDVDAGPADMQGYTAGHACGFSTNSSAKMVYSSTILKYQGSPKTFNLTFQTFPVKEDFTCFKNRSATGVKL